QKALPLRDLAGMLRSLAYLSSTLEQRGRAVDAGWDREAREHLVAGYHATAPAALLPATDDAQRRQLALFELEKAFYAVRYELDPRPDWVWIPVRSILDLLDHGAP